MRFAREIWLYAVPLVPLVWLYLRWGDRRGRAGLRVLLGTQGPLHVEGDHPRMRAWNRFLALAGMFWLLLAAARPQWGANEVTVTQRGSDVVVALDISNSMLAEDVVPNRIGRAKAELEAFLDRLQDSRIGLVFFAGSAFVQCPLTLDYGTVRIFLDMAGPDMLSEQGTAIAAALQTSHDLLTRGRGDSRPGFQAILLVTDGEDLEGNWEAAAKKCQDDGIRIIPVGVGSLEGGLIPVTDDQGKSSGFMKGPDGKVVMSRLNMAALDKLAAMGGGSAFRIGVDGMAGDRLFLELDRLGKRNLEDRRISSYQDRYLWPLLLALLCFAGRLLLQTGKWGSTKKGLPEAAAVALAVLVFPGPLARAGIVTPQTEAMVRGRDSYLHEDYQGALTQFGAALVHDPDNPRISLAMGEALNRLKKYDDAVREFDRTLSLTQDPQLRAEALYNSGTTLLEAGKPQDAVGPLRASLALDPDQPDALLNLERALALQQQQQQQQKSDQDKDQKKKQDQKNQQDNQQQQDQQQQDQQQQDQQQQDQQQQDQQQQDQQQQDQQQKQQQDQQKDQSKQDQAKQDQEQQQQQQQQQQQPKPEDKNQDQAKPKPSSQQNEGDQQEDAAQLDKEHALQILKALDRDEQELKRSVQMRLKGGKPKSGKRW